MGRGCLGACVLGRTRLWKKPLADKDLQQPKDYGTLVPVGGGDPIPLLKKTLLMGRRESCDIVLRFKNVSAHHCKLMIRDGYWYVKDLKSLNGVKVNKASISEERLSSGDLLSIAKHRYRIFYVPSDLGAVGPPPPSEPPAEIFGESLLRRAGLEKKRGVRNKVQSRGRHKIEIDADPDSDVDPEADTPRSKPPSD